ncbi:C40 family peptidase [Sporosarcina sp. Sa2YVA2]|uniref:C40 family peptidase n=1 Tax=Sporosarcina quadrami TaxID=2762234 RepID=A0ABR8UA63_9BACL|nr:C40 family peptidase [Sporosarcina quadrami]MBD7984690.1 C40 family peptidase [Sporosarcina quadrami]
MRILAHAQKSFVILALSFVLFVTPFISQAQASSHDTVGLIDTATSLKGIKYKYGGTTTAGFDCSGFIQYVFKKHDLNLPRTTSGMHATGVKVDKAELAAGDLVFFNTTGKGVSHAGIYVGDGKFVHASTSKGVSVDALDDPYYWGKRYIGAKRINGSSDVAFAK